jgi:hypothetical protein
LADIPEQWIDALAKRTEVENLFNAFSQLFETKA